MWKGYRVLPADEEISLASKFRHRHPKANDLSKFKPFLRQGYYPWLLLQQSERLGR
jgi:hypothetical protein